MSPRACSAPSRAGASSSLSARPAPGRVLAGLASSKLSTDSYEIVTKTLGAVTEFDNLVNRSLTDFPQFFPRQTRVVIDSNDRGDSEMRQLLRVEAGEPLKGDRMSRVHSARERVFAIAGPDWQELRASIGRHLPKTELLRRAGSGAPPVFASLACLGFAFPDGSGQASALDCCAAERLALHRRQRRAQLKDKTLEARRELAGALAGSLPKGATRRWAHRAARRRRWQYPGACAARRLATPATCSPFSVPSSRSPPSAPRPASCA